jgi:hypothetical protein
VISESDAPKNGFQNCPDTAYQVIQGNSGLAGRVKCAAESTQDPLPCTFSARNTKNRGG